MICAPAVERPAVRMGVWGRDSRELCEDGADDHTSNRQTRSLCGKAGWAQSPRGGAASQYSILPLRSSIIGVKRQRALVRRGTV